MKKISANNITMKENIETKEAKKLKNNKVKKFIAIPIVPLILAIIFAIINFADTRYTQLSLMILMYICILLFFIGLIVFFILMTPYFQLIRTAKKNDKIRYEEKIRFNERKRLEQNNDETITRAKVKETIKEEKTES